jgi:hypothetical protein
LILQVGNNDCLPSRARTVKDRGKSISYLNSSSKNTLEHVKILVFCYLCLINIHNSCDKCLKNFSLKIPHLLWETQLIAWKIGVALGNSNCFRSYHFIYMKILFIFQISVDFWDICKLILFLMSANNYWYSVKPQIPELNSTENIMKTVLRHS